MSPIPYKALVSSDWSECLSPNGPFDVAAFTFPNLADELSRIFRAYTGNHMSLTEAIARVARLLPEPVTIEHIDAYLDAAFATYTHVPRFIERLLSHDALFMLNTTGTHGYFQRAVAKKLLPPVPIIAANPFIAFPQISVPTEFPCNVLEIADKPRCTLEVATRFAIPLQRVAVIGDSGGDGPHFHWARRSGALCVAAMPKESLIAYCANHGFAPDLKFGVKYGPGDMRDLNAESQVDFDALADLLLDHFAHGSEAPSC